MRVRPGNAWKSWAKRSGAGSRCTGRTWRRRTTMPVGRCCRRRRRWWTAFTSPRSSTKSSTGSGKKITRAYKEKLTKAERKEFHALMWEFRKDPQELSGEDKRKLAELFRKLPQLRTLHEFRRRFQRIFDTARKRQRAHQRLLHLFFDMMDSFPELEGFVGTFEHWQEEILNYFDAHQTSGP